MSPVTACEGASVSAARGFEVDVRRSAFKKIPPAAKQKRERERIRQRENGGPGLKLRPKVDGEEKCL